jgi:hypothetical protein
LAGRRQLLFPETTLWPAATMNPYEANISNTVARLGAWGRGMLRRYRRPLWAIFAATATIAIGVSAAQAPVAPKVIVAR